jgi:hypothetical protein
LILLVFSVSIGRQSRHERRTKAVSPWLGGHNAENRLRGLKKSLWICLPSIRNTTW